MAVRFKVKLLKCIFFQEWSLPPAERMSGEMGRSGVSTFSWVSTFCCECHEDMKEGKGGAHKQGWICFSLFYDEGSSPVLRFTIPWLLKTKHTYAYATALSARSSFPNDPAYPLAPDRRRVGKSIDIEGVRWSHIPKPSKYNTQCNWMFLSCPMVSKNHSEA